MSGGLSAVSPGFHHGGGEETPGLVNLVSNHYLEAEQSPSQRQTGKDLPGFQKSGDSKHLVTPTHLLNNCRVRSLTLLEIMATDTY